VNSLATRSNPTSFFLKHLFAVSNEAGGHLPQLILAFDGFLNSQQDCCVPLFKPRDGVVAAYSISEGVYVSLLHGTYKRLQTQPVMVSLEGGLPHNTAEFVITYYYSIYYYHHYY
jgi:hypothetical protein